MEECAGGARVEVNLHTLKNGKSVGGWREKVDTLLLLSVIGFAVALAVAGFLVDLFTVDYRAISTDILEFRGRVLVIQAARGGYGKAAPISNTVLPVYSGDRAIRLSRALASRRTGPWCSVVGCR